MASSDKSGGFGLDNSRLIEVSKPLFYGLIFLAGLSFTTSSAVSGTLFGLAVLSAITFVSAALAESLEDDWKRFLDLIAVTSLLLVVLFSAYTSAMLSFT